MLFYETFATKISFLQIFSGFTPFFSYIYRTIICIVAKDFAEIESSEVGLCSVLGNGSYKMFIPFYMNLWTYIFIVNNSGLSSKPVI